MGSHGLPVHAERAVVGWLVGYGAIRLYRPNASVSRQAHEAFDHVEQWLGNTCALELSRPDDPMALDAFLGTLVDDLAREIETKADRLGPAEQELLGSVADEAQRRADAYTTEHTGDLDHVIAWAMACVRSWYVRVADGADARFDGVATLVACSLDALPPGTIDPWGVAGSTTFPAAGPATSVSLLFGRPMTAEAWFASTYVLMHELVSHAAQGPWDERCTSPAEDDPFAEGWMDLVAIAVHRASLDGLGPADIPVPEAASDFIHTSEALHAARRDQPELSAARRRVGMDTADALRRYMLTPERRPDNFLALSLALNASALSHAERQVVEQATRRALVVPDREGGEFLLLLTSYLHHRDERRLAATANALVSGKGGGRSIFTKH